MASGQVLKGVKVVSVRVEKPKFQLKTNNGSSKRKANHRSCVLAPNDWTLATRK